MLENAFQQHLKDIKVPTSSTNIYKDECMYSYDTPEIGGLYISLTTFLGVGENYVASYARRNSSYVFLHIRREKHKIAGETPPEGDVTSGSGPERKITRLAIGVEGGFTTNEDKTKYEYKDIYNIVIFPEKKIIPYPNSDLPLLIQQSADAVIAAESAISKLEKLALSGTWDGEVRVNSKYANDLKQLDNGKKIPPSGWKCEKCDLTSNIWLNLTDGSILCGRRFFDGSGGNDHAVEHYKLTGYPLAVKLGTITADGKGDVYSYSEDDMVQDPKLAEHLAHFGIKVQQMEKSEKSMVELEIAINQRIGEWSILTESESQLVPVTGPGYTGMKNLGNSCYLNSVMQVLFTVPDFIERFFVNSKQYFEKNESSPQLDFNIQTAKLANGLLSGKYSSVAENTLDSEATGISPAMFKNLIGKDHPDFSTKQQQDALDFLLYMFTLLERNSRGEAKNPSEAFKFCVEDRIECNSSNQVKYMKREEFCLSLAIPLELATNSEEVKAYQEEQAANAGKKSNEKIIRPRITLESLINRFARTEIIDQYFSTAIKDKTTAKKYSRLVSMPDYLLVHLKKFTLREDWVPIKLDVAIDNVDELDLSNIRSLGLQPDEKLLPDLEQSDVVPKPEFDQVVIDSLLTMGFPIDACKRAIFNTKNSGLELATDWLMQHIGDSDLNSPFVVPGGAINQAFVPNPDSLSMLMNMGFDIQRSTKALKETNNNIERATDWIFAHIDQNFMECEQNEEVAAEATGAKKYRDGGSKYKLVAFISHMGTSSHVGHYVCHILKDDKWVIYNDTKVAISQNPPKDLGYLYFYKREN